MNKDKKTIGIIGFGRFGVFIASILAKHCASKILIYKHRDTAEYKRKTRKIKAQLVDLETACTSDIVILATPISRTEATIKKISKLLKPGSLLLDTCSIKKYPCAWLEKYISQNIEIMGTHPIFGPGPANFNFSKQTWDIENFQIVLCPLRIQDKKLKSISNFLKNKLKLKIIKTTPEDHDRQAVHTFNLTHFLARTLWETGLRKQEIQTPAFQNLIKNYYTIDNDWQLVYDMFRYNPYAKNIIKKFIKSCEKIQNKININV